MKPGSGLPLALSYCVFLVICYEHTVVSSYQMGEDDYNYDDDYYYEEMKKSYGDRGGGPTGSATQQQQHSSHTSSQHTIPCYSCHFILQHNHQQGLVNCKDPFSTFDIPTVDCKGACAKVYRKLEGKADFDISRNCMPNCKEFRTEKANIECCTTELCNGSVAASSLNSNCRTMAIAVIAVKLLFLLLR